MERTQASCRHRQLSYAEDDELTSSAGERHVHTSESVHFLPGAIDITTLRAIQRGRRNASDFEVILRSMVRGHWRRAAPGWSDQRLRWIKPYWRGPSAAAVIERQYRLRP